jgi:hypothetical protein
VTQSTTWRRSFAVPLPEQFEQLARPHLRRHHDRSLVGCVVAEEADQELSLARERGPESKIDVLAGNSSTGSTPSVEYAIVREHADADASSCGYQER